MSVCLQQIDTARKVVGAAGFEPTTWSTQNSRATRLRYAPVPRAPSIHALRRADKRLAPAPSAMSAAWQFGKEIPDRHGGIQVLALERHRVPTVLHRMQN